MSFDSQHIIIFSKLIYCSKDHHFSSHTHFWFDLQCQALNNVIVQQNDSRFTVLRFPGSIPTGTNKIICSTINSYGNVISYILHDKFLQECNKITTYIINSYRNVISYILHNKFLQEVKKIRCNLLHSHRNLSCYILSYLFLQEQILEILRL